MLQHHEIYGGFLPDILAGRLASELRRIGDELFRTSGAFLLSWTIFYITWTGYRYKYKESRLWCGKVPCLTYWFFDEN